MTTANEQSKEIWVSKTPSTMEIAKRELGDSPHLMVVAKIQTHARGTKGRKWICKPGNLFMTVGIKGSLIPDPGLLPIYSGLAIIRSVKNLLREPDGNMARLKWPNDLMFEGKKAGGVLIETEKQNFFIGIGINLAQAPDVTDGGRASTCLKYYGFMPGQMASLARDIYQEFISFCLHTQNRKDILEKWKNALDWETPLVSRSRPPITYMPVSVDKWGQLKAKDSEGNTRLFNSEYFF